MNSPVRRREFEADCHRTNNFSDRKRANKFGSQLITHGPERNVLGRKPHFLTHDVDGRLRPVAISLSLGARPHPEESLSDEDTSGRRREQRGPRLRIPY